ncbi:hypothetical protein [Mesorhizobium wenxiniae]|uniref:MarR family transcriptional regulator n=1 Tax=Mesorhizobium wenxiniae TaxID=2014805 RepID=A0A271KGB0_9HYPH|nr:hypothetical protein [Mesorhizobium wenxiniae]PAP94019.1 hypothetical protein CIT31_16770 [Mesorhizobium wenxiniae]
MTTATKTRQDFGLTGADDIILRQIVDRERGDGMRFPTHRAAVERLEDLGFVATVRCSGTMLVVATKAGRDAIAALSA